MLSVYLDEDFIKLKKKVKPKQMVTTDTSFNNGVLRCMHNVIQTFYEDVAQWRKS